MARIGSTCLVQLIENNCSKMDSDTWDKICDTFVHLFDLTTPSGLFLDTDATSEVTDDGISTGVIHRRVYIHIYLFIGLSYDYCSVCITSIGDSNST